MNAYSYSINGVVVGSESGAASRLVLTVRTGRKVRNVETETGFPLVEEEEQYTVVPGTTSIVSSMGKVINSNLATMGMSPKYIQILGTKPTIQQPLPKVQETILTSDLKKQVDVWGFDTMTADDKAGKVVKKKNWEQSLGLPNWGADASIMDMGRWLLYLAAAGIAFVAIDFATKD